MKTWFCVGPDTAGILCLDVAENYHDLNHWKVDMNKVPKDATAVILRKARTSPMMNEYREQQIEKYLASLPEDKKRLFYDKMNSGDRYIALISFLLNQLGVEISEQQLKQSFS